MKNTAYIVRRVVYTAAGLLGVLALVLSLAVSPSALGPAQEAPSTPEADSKWYPRPAVRAFEVETPALTIYDLSGQEQDWNWLIETFGAVTLTRGSGAAHVAVLRAVEGPTALVVRVETATGSPVEGIPVVFHWPDAPYLAPEQQACGLERGIVGYTNANGDVGFGMGGGAYYFPPSGGPHTVWLALDGTDCLGGLGMLGGTNHIHLDSVWRLSTLTVDTTVDSNAPEYQQCTMALNDCSLRGALSAANAEPGKEHTIFLPAGTYTLNLPGPDEDGNASGDLDITTSNLTLTGAASASTIIDGSQLDRVLHVHGGATVEMENITLRNGRTADGEAGGGLYNAGTLTLNQCTVTSSLTGQGSSPAASKGGDGGGIYNAGTLTLSGTTVSANATGRGSDGGGSGGDGGGVYNAGTLALNSTMVISNTTGSGGEGASDVLTAYGGAGGAGAGLYNSGALVLESGSVTGNKTGDGGDAGSTGEAQGGAGGPGGGVYNAGSLTVAGSLLTSNATGGGGHGRAVSGYGGSGGSGGGIHNAGTLILHGATVRGNTTGGGGTGQGAIARGGHGGSGAGIFSDESGEVRNSSLEGNATGPGGTADCEPAGCDALGGDGGDGGGLYYASGLALAVQTSRVSDNATGEGGGVIDTEPNPGAGGDGGGLYFQDSSPELRDITISDNSAAGHGGGLYNQQGSPSLFDVVVSGNAAAGNGGGLYSREGSPTLRHGVLSGNTAGGNGGGIYNQGGSPSLIYITFRDNHLSNGRGAGMANLQGESLLIDVTFMENVLDAGEGAGLHNEGGSPLLINVTFAGNQVLGEGNGGGLHNLGGKPRLINTLFSGNRSGLYGGGVYNLDSSLVMTHTTLSGNTAHGGSGLFNDGAGVPIVRNSVFWGNTGGSQIEWQSTVPDVQFSIVQSGTTGLRNLDADPQFVRAPDPGDGSWSTLWDNDYGNLRLRVTSPAIDAADNNALPPDQLDLDGDGDVTEPLPVALDGAFRSADISSVPDTGEGAPPVSDMGAHERRPAFYLPLLLHYFEP